MTDFLKNIEPVLLVVFGWLMGLLSPAIVERIRRDGRLDAAARRHGLEKLLLP